MPNIRGLTLMQIVVALAILMILVLFIYPNYTSHLINTRRENAEETMMQIASALETYHTTNSTYETVDLSKIGYADKTKDGAYDLSLTDLDESNYSIVATPSGSQEKDKECGTLTLTSNLEKKTSGYGNPSLCW